MGSEDGHRRDCCNGIRIVMVVLILAGLISALMWKGVEKKNGPADLYTGSASCRDCHERFHRLWSKSHHGLAMQPFTTQLAEQQLTLPAEPLTISNALYHVVLDAEKPMIVEQLAGVSKEYPIVYAMGGKNVFFFLTPFERGRLQVLPLAYDVNRREWYDTTKSMIRHALADDVPVHWTDPLLTFNTSCYGCHVSQFDANYDLATDSYMTEWKEPGINCETCHGPANEHIRVCSSAPKGRPPEDLKIIRTSMFSSKQHNDACLSCHAKAGRITGRYPPGAEFFDHFDLAVLENSDYYPDGRDLGENYTMTSWLMSSCVKAGELNCLDCHTSSGRYRFAETNANNVCLPCHKALVDNPAEHTHHGADSEGSSCVACHMPKTEFGRMHRSDHSMRAPAPSATIEFGSENACNICHEDKEPDWADKYVREWYENDYQAPILEAGRLVKAAREGKWEQLAAMAAYLQRKDKDEVVAVSLLRLMGACRDERKWQVAGYCYADESPLIRSAAVALLEGATDRQAREVLVKAADDEIRLVRIRAASALSGWPRNMFQSDELPIIDAAFVELEKSCGVQLDSWVSHYNLGNYYASRQWLEKAGQAFVTAHKLRADVVQPLVNLSMVQARLGKNDQAEKSLRSALEIDGKNAAIHFNLGLLLGEKGDTTGAVQHLRSAWKYDATMGAAAFNLGVILLQKNQDEGLAFLRSACRVEPDNPRYGYSLAFYLYEAKQTGEALTVLDRLIMAHPDYHDALKLRAAIIRDAGK